MREWLYLIFCFLISMIGYEIHKSILWAIIDFYFAPFALLKWIFYHEITLTVLHKTFEWFFK